MLQVTTLTTAFFCVLMVLLSIHTSLRRRQLRTSFGDAGDETLRRRIRAHGNFIEYAPLALILLGLVEVQGSGRTLVVTLACGLAGARVLHAIGMLFTSGRSLRAIGMVIQHLSFLYGAFLLAHHALTNN